MHLSSATQRRLVGLVCLLFTLLACQASSAAVSTGAPGTTHGDRRARDLTPSLANPGANRSPSSDTQACFASALSAACENAALGDINAARAAEGVGPMVLPTNFDSLSPALQLLVLANLERVARGLIPAQGLSAALDATAAAGAAADTDPVPSVFHGDAISSNWAGGSASTLLIDFMWMYDDGLDSGNLDCTPGNTSGCWGHREDILYPFHAPLMMGAAYDPSTQYGPSLAELFVGGDLATAVGDVDALLSPTWAMLSQSLQLVLSATSLQLTPGSGSSQLTIRASSQSVDVQAAITSATPGWQVSPSSCHLAPGASCQLTVANSAAATGTTATLTVSSPAGSYSIPLSNQVPAALSMTVLKPAVPPGAADTITAHLTAPARTAVGGQLVTLYARRGTAGAPATVARARTSASGTVNFHVAPRADTQYSLSFGGSATLSAASSQATVVRVRRTRHG